MFSSLSHVVCEINTSFIDLKIDIKLDVNYTIRNNNNNNNIAGAESI